MIRFLKNKLYSFLKYRLTRLSFIEKTVSYPNTCEIVASELHGKISLSEHVKLRNVTAVGNITIGRYTSCCGPNLGLYSEINPIKIGNFCSIASDVTFLESYHNQSYATTYFIRKNVLKQNLSSFDIISKGPIYVGHDVWIGKGAKIMSGVTIGTGAVIGANAVVTKNIPPYAIAVGCPAKVMKYRFGEDTVARLLKSEWWNLPIETISSLSGVIDNVDSFLNKLGY